MLKMHTLEQPASGSIQHFSSIELLPVSQIFSIYTDLNLILEAVAVSRIMQYIYYFANTSLVLRLLTRLAEQESIRLESATVIYLVDRWIVRVGLEEALRPCQHQDFLAFLNENGTPFSLTPRLASALDSLEAGASPTEVMKRHHVVVVSHGELKPIELTEFRSMFVQGLGYCPPSLV